MCTTRRLRETQKRSIGQFNNQIFSFLRKSIVPNFLHIGFESSTLEIGNIQVGQNGRIQRINDVDLGTLALVNAFPIDTFDNWGHNIGGLKVINSLQWFEYAGNWDRIPY
jgi:hypothetical protein